jgi:nickel-dependent lactate racemase
MAVHQAPRAEADGRSPREKVRDAIESPFGFEPLRRALTPDDHITVVLDAALPHAAELLAGVLDHLATAGIEPAAVTVVSPPGSREDWIDDLPDEFADVTAETHDPADRKKLAYLATTKAGRRIYLNRTLVEADFIIVLTGRRFDPVRKYAGAEIALYPDLADEEIIAANAGPFTKQQPWAGQDESHEVAWLLGTPFLIQVIEGEGDDIQDVVAGLLDSSAEGRRRQDARWKWQTEGKADLAIASVSGDPERLTFLDLAKAAACAAKTVRKGGRVALLTEAAPILGEAAEMIRGLDEPKSPESRLAKEKPADWAACRLWCLAAAHASLFLAGHYPEELVEELFATPLQSPDEVQRLVDAAKSVVVIPDAHKAKVKVLEPA